MADNRDHEFTLPIAHAIRVIKGLTEIYQPWSQQAHIAVIIQLLEITKTSCDEILDAYIPPSDLLNAQGAALINGYKAAKPHVEELVGTFETLTCVRETGEPTPPYTTATRTLNNLQEILASFRCSLAPYQRVLRIVPLTENLRFIAHLDAFFRDTCDGFSNNAYISPTELDKDAMLPVRSIQRGNLSRYLRGTGLSFFTNHQLLSWLASEKDIIFWLKGVSASGKTVLASMLVEMLEVKLPSSDIGIAFAFFAPGGPTVPMEQVFHVLTQQLVSRMTHVPAHLQGLQNRVLPPATSVDAFQLATMCFKHTFVVIDGILEASAREFREHQSSLFRGRGPPVHLLLTHVTGPNRPCPQPSLSLTLWMTKAEIRTLVSRAYSFRSYLVSITSRPDAFSKDSIWNTLVARANGGLVHPAYKT